MANIYKGRLDIKSTSAKFSPVFVQYDKGRLEIELLDNGEPYDISTINRVEFTHVRKDGLVIIEPGEIVRRAEGNVLCYDYQGSEMELLGKIKTSLAIFDSESNKVSTHVFEVTVTEDLRNEVFNPAEPNAGLLEQLLQEVQYVKDHPGPQGPPGEKGDPGEGGYTLTALVVDNPAVDNKTALQNALSNTYKTFIDLPEGTIHTSKIGMNINGKYVRGIPGKTKITTTDTVALFMYNTKDVVFQDIIFESTNTTESIEGVINCNDDNFENVKFIRCTFTSRAGNGLKVINEGTERTKNVTFDSCIFKDIGRMGAEFQNHNETTIAMRYSDVHFNNCIFENIGTNGDDGMAISMSGEGEFVTVKNCTFKNCKNIGVELIGCSNVLVDGAMFSSTADEYAPINITGFRKNSHITVTNCTISGDVGNINIYEADRLLFTNNNFKNFGQVYVRDSTGCLFANNILRGYDSYVMFFDNSSNNDIRNNVFDNTDADGNYTVVRFYGEESTSNRFLYNTLFKAPNGNFVGETNGADNNIFIQNYLGDYMDE